MAVHVLTPRENVTYLQQDQRGYYKGIVNGAEPGSLYYFLLDGEKERPDPASRYQPRGVHGPSQVVDTGTFAWEDDGWTGQAQENLIIYELHVGTFTPEGTFAAVEKQLPTLKELGITAIELMPVAQFPGGRNWGYDGVYPYAVQNTYGGPEGLQRLVNACHRHGLAVILDVVYNHFGPEGNYLDDFAPYFTDRYRTPWGKAINFDGPGSDEVRRFFIANALYWLKEFHIDGFRLDAVHAIKDFSARPFLHELVTAVHRQAELLGRRVQVIAESDLNDPEIINRPEVGGMGLDAQWSDDFHHALHVLLTGEDDGYYQDFNLVGDLAKAWCSGYVYTGQYSAYRRRRHGDMPRLCPAKRFVVFAQNHDQVGNRAAGERLSVLTSFAGLKLAACVVFLSPYLPLIFMGEEYGETAPFQYFTSHQDAGVAEAVRKGRREEFSRFKWGETVPDPQDAKTFLRSRLQYDLRLKGHHRVLVHLYRKLIKLRRDIPALREMNLDHVEAIAWEEEKVLFIRRWSDNDEVCIIFSFNRSSPCNVNLPLPDGTWFKQLDTAEACWLGEGVPTPTKLEKQGALRLHVSPMSCILYRRGKEELT